MLEINFKAIQEARKDRILAVIVARKTELPDLLKKLVINCLIVFRVTYLKFFDTMLKID